MKNRKSGRFWSLRPRLAAAHLEVACSLAALALFAMVLEQPATAGPVVSTAAPTAVASSSAFPENPLAAAPMVPQACIKRVLALSRKQLHFDLVGVMERECFGIVSASISRPVAAVSACLSPVGWHAAYSRRLVTGCLPD